MKKKIPEVNPTRIDESLLGIKRFGETVTPLRLGSAAATDFLREESVRQTEELLKKACEKAKLCNLTADDLKEIIDMLYGGEM